MVNLSIPKHIAIVMDGNGRWAQQRGRSRVFGHVRGSSRVKAIVEKAQKLGIQALTLYVFSTENWSRPESEIKALWKLLKKYLIQDTEELAQRNIRVHVIGEIERLDKEVQELLLPLLTRLSKNTGLQLTFALSYGGRRELIRAAQLFAQECLEGRLKPMEMNEQMMEKYLWTAELKELAPVDLFIRTSGEQRISNFLLWQSAYAELVFLDVYWPDFSPHHLEIAIQEYAQRERRLGNLTLPYPQNQYESVRTRA